MFFEQIQNDFYVFAASFLSCSLHTKCNGHREVEFFQKSSILFN